MGEEEQQRGKLASVGSDNTQRRLSIRERVQDATREREEDEPRFPVRLASDQWAGFWASSVWEKGIVVGGSVLAVVAAIVAFVAISGGGSDEPKAAAGSPPVLRPTWVPTATRQPTVESTVVAPTQTAQFVAAQPTVQPSAAPSSATQRPPANRQNCQEISGTAYLSSAERAWYLANCVSSEEPGDSVVPRPGPGPDGGSPTDAPPPTPAPSATPSGMSPSQAITLAAEWMTAQSQNAYIISPASCNATQMGARWIVICQGDLQGCQGDACRSTFSACVFDEPRYVAPANSC